MENARHKYAVFISYRRGDSADVAGRLYEHIAATFGRHAVFKDVNSLRLGTPFDEDIKSAIEAADTILILIGQRWLSERDEAGNRRIDNPADYVRREIGHALAKNKHIVPVLLGDAQMPQANDLPISLRQLTKYNSARLRPDPDFRVDIDRITGALCNHAVSCPACGSCPVCGSEECPGVLIEQDTICQRCGALVQPRDGKQREPELPPPAMAVVHQVAALPLHLLIVCIFGALALASIAGGVYATAVNSMSATKLRLFGADLSTGHVGAVLFSSDSSSRYSRSVRC